MNWLLLSLAMIGDAPLADAPLAEPPLATLAKPAAPARHATYRWLADLPGQLSLWRGTVQVGAYRLADGVYLKLAGVYPRTWEVADLPFPLPTTPAQKPAATAPYSSPPGTHRHIDSAGNVWQHGDQNQGNWSAHVSPFTGEPPPGTVQHWSIPKYYGSRAPALVRP